MPWLKVSDQAATHPLVAGVLEQAVPDRPADEQLMLPAVFGFVALCAVKAAAHKTDYRVSLGTARQVAGSWATDLLALATRAGLMVEMREDGSTWWVITQEEDLLHMRTKGELEWEKAQRRDAADVSLTGPVRARDGDGCRYCGQVVNWRDRRGGRGGTYDHRNPGRPATSPEDLVVACKSCNSGRKDHPERDVRYPLRPAPTDPYYSDLTLAWLTTHAVPLPPAAGRPPNTATTSTAPTAPPPAGNRGQRRPGTQPGDASGALPAPLAGRPPNTATTSPAPTAPPPAGHRGPGGLAQEPPNTAITPARADLGDTDLQEPADPADHLAVDRDGTGRVGPPGRVPVRVTATGEPTSKPRRPRNRRRRGGDP